MLQKSSLPSRKRQVEISHTYRMQSSGCWHFVLIWIESGIKYNRAMASCHFQPDLAGKQELLPLKLFWYFVAQKFFGSIKSPSQDFSQTLISWKLLRSHFYCNTKENIQKWLPDNASSLRNLSAEENHLRYHPPQLFAFFTQPDTTVSQQLL